MGTGVLTLACGGGGGSTTSYSERSFSSYRGCSRDGGHPSLTLMAPSDDGTVSELWTIGNDDEVKWGYDTTVRMVHHRNGFTQHTSTRVDEVVAAVPTPGLDFRMRACGPSFLGEDRRSLIDGKAFTCTEAICDALDTRVDGGGRFDLLFTIAEEVDGPLVLRGVEDRTCANELDCGARDECRDGRCVLWTTPRSAPP